MRTAVPALPWAAGAILLVLLPGSGAALAWAGALLGLAAAAALLVLGLRSSKQGWLDGALAATVAAAALHDPALGSVPQLALALAGLALCGWAHALASAHARGPRVPLGLVGRKALVTLAAAGLLAALVLLSPVLLAGLVSPRWAASRDAHSVALQALAGLALACIGAAIILFRLALRRREAKSGEAA